MVSLLTYLLLFVVPLIVIPNISLRFEPPKVLLSELLIGLLIISSFTTGKFSLKRVSKPFLGVLLGLFLLSLGHLILNPSPSGLFGNIFRLQGTILFWFLLMLTLIAQNIYFRLKEKYIYTAGFLAICVGAVVFGTNRAGRWIGSLGEPNALAGVTIFIFPFVFLSFKNIWLRLLSIIGVIGVINFTESKSALIGFVLELLFLGLVKVFKGKYLIGVIICSILLISSLILPVSERIYFLRTNTDPQNYRFEDRTQIWQIALVTGMDYPLLGSGLDSVQDQIRKTAQKLNFDAQYQVIDSSHNIFLDFWVWGGALGVGLLMTLVIWALKNMVQKKMALELTVFIGLLTVLSFNPTTVSILAAFWWLIGRSFVKPAGQE
jgi:O-antigen ligase